MRTLRCLLPLLLLSALACEDPFLNQTYIEPTNEDLELSNAAFLNKHAEDFSLWIALLKHADLYNALNDAATTSTVFAPSNAAMEAFLAWKGVTSVEDLDATYARYVAQVHILPYDLNESTFITYVESGSIPIPTVFGSYLTTSYGFINTDVDDVDKDTVRVQDSLSIYLNNQARVVALAKRTANGQVYTLGGVIKPLSETILDVLRPYREYNLFIEAAEKTGYADTLAIYADTVYNLDGSRSVNDVRFTCLVVPDAVYQAAGIHTFEDLVAHLGAGNDYTHPDNALHRYVAYHLLGNSLSKQQLFTFQEPGQVVLFDTKLSGYVITVERRNGEELINGGAHIVRSGIRARNGLIHKVDHLLPVYEPAPVTVRWDFCNSPDIQSFVNAYGASRNLGELFSSPLANKEYQIDLSDDRRDGHFGTITAFTYQANTTKTSTSTWRRVGFFKCQYLNNSNRTINTYGAYMDNLLVLNLGYAGWIQFRTPTIVKGTYKVVLYYASAPGLKSYYTGGSLTKFNLDDYQKSVYIWKGLPAKFIDPAKQSNENASGIAAEVIWESISFDRSEGHVFKATMMDISAKTVGTYRQMWDYMEFIPINE